MKVFWTHQAVEDLKSIGRFIGIDSLEAARRHIESLKARAGSVAVFPNSGRVVPEFGREDLREVLDGSYRIVYRVLEDRIDVITVFEGHRLLDPQRFRGGR